jgi:hypothetical protein
MENMKRNLNLKNNSKQKTKTVKKKAGQYQTLDEQIQMFAEIIASNILKELAKGKKFKIFNYYQLTEGEIQ